MSESRLWWGPENQVRCAPEVPPDGLVELVNELAKACSELIGAGHGLKSRTPAVCSALGSSQFLREAGLRLVERVGPRQSTTTEFRYEILDRSTDDTADVATDQVSDPPCISLTVPKPRVSLNGLGRWLFLVACVKTKLPRRAATKDLYVSDWFRKARACVESTGCPWAMLSVECGCVISTK